MSKFVVTITGPSCAGKSTLEQMLKKRGFGSVISHTTRAPRPGEVDGVNYFFLSKEEFQRRVANGEFIEVVTFNGNLYGSTIAEFERNFALGKPVAVVVEPHGREQIQLEGNKLGWRVISVFIDNPMEVIMERWLQRIRVELLESSDDGAIIQRYAKRLAYVLKEESEWRKLENRLNKYDLDAMRFDADNSGYIVEQICAFVGLGIEDLALGSLSKV